MCNNHSIKMKNPKEELNPKSLTENWIYLLSYGGCNLRKKTILGNVINALYIFICCGVIMFSMTEFFVTKINTISEFARIAMICVGYIQVTSKFILCRFKSYALKEMIKIIWNKFWPLDFANLSTKVKITKTYKFINLITKIYGFFLLGSIFSIVLVTGNKTLPLDLRFPNKDFLKHSPNFEIAYVIEILFMISHNLFCLIPIDAIFVTMIGLVSCQFNLLKDAILCIGKKDKNNFHLVKKCVEHHNLMLRFLEMLESVYSNAILLTIGSGLMLASLNLYAIVMEDDNSLKALFVVLYICIFLQLYFYCQAGQIIQDEVESISKAAYNCTWYTLPNSAIKGVQLIILRGNKRFNITAGGLMILNLESFANVVQASFSFLTFLKNIKS